MRSAPPVIVPSGAIVASTQVIAIPAVLERVADHLEPHQPRMRTGAAVGLEPRAGAAILAVDRLRWLGRRRGRLGRWRRGTATRAPRAASRPARIVFIALLAKAPRCALMRRARRFGKLLRRRARAFPQGSPAWSGGSMCCLPGAARCVPARTHRPRPARAVAPRRRRSSAARHRPRSRGSPGRATARGIQLDRQAGRPEHDPLHRHAQPALLVRQPQLGWRVGARGDPQRRTGRVDVEGMAAVAHLARIDPQAVHQQMQVGVIGQFDRGPGLGQLEQACPQGCDHRTVGHDRRAGRWRRRVVPVRVDVLEQPPIAVAAVAFRRRPVGDQHVMRIELQMVDHHAARMVLRYCIAINGIFPSRP